MAYQVVRKLTQPVVLGSLLVGLLNVLGRLRLATPVPYLLLFPGIIAGALAPDSGYNAEGDLHPWGPVSVGIMYLVNIGLYSGLMALLLLAGRSLRRSAH